MCLCKQTYSKIKAVAEYLLRTDQEQTKNRPRRRGYDVYHQKVQLSSNPSHHPSKLYSLSQLALKFLDKKMVSLRSQDWIRTIPLEPIGTWTG